MSYPQSKSKYYAQAYDKNLFSFVDDFVKSVPGFLSGTTMAFLGDPLNPSVAGAGSDITPMNQGSMNVSGFKPTKKGLVQKAARPVVKAVSGLLDTPKDPMIVQHNLNQETLERIQRMGGIPSPSMAVSKVDEPLVGFGDISLLGTQEMAKPSRTNPVWGADAYTSRTPEIEMIPNKKAEQIVTDKYQRPIEKKYGPNVFGDDSMIAEQIFKLTSPENASTPLRAIYLKSKGIKVDTIKDSNDLKPKSLDDIPLDMDNLDDLFFGDDVPKVKTIKPKKKKEDPEFVFQKNKTSLNDKFNEYLFQVDDKLSLERRADFLRWIKRQRDKLVAEGGEFSERFFDRYTYAGDRRYKPATLKNVVKKMKGGAGGENWSGAGQMRAIVMPKFKSLDEIKKARGRISLEKFKKAKDDTDQLHADLQGEARDYMEQYIPDVGYSTIDELTEDLVKGQKIFNYFGDNAQNLEKYQRFIAEMPESLKQKAKELREAYQAMPTEYFEIKPQRGVELSEFGGAIIPKTMPKYLTQILKDSGIKKILTYGTPEERKALFKKFPELMFAFPVVGAGLINEQQNSESLLN
tara:strand:- start:185 stop:1909 length:1725 start_codon:yes stop_codon:yes gene_type:complete